MVHLRESRDEFLGTFKEYVMSGLYDKDVLVTAYQIALWKDEDLETLNKLIDLDFNYKEIEYHISIITKKRTTRIINNTMRIAILKEQKWRCNNCASQLKYSIRSDWGGEIANIDHIHPFADRDSYKGNVNERQNLQALCVRCNSLKQRGKN